MIEAVHTILLAAGFGRRHPGKLARMVEGTPVIVRAVEALRAADLRPHVVFGHEEEALRALLEDYHPEGWTAVSNPDYAEGMASSLHAGVRIAPPEAGAILLHLADKPFVKRESVRTLLRRWQEARPRLLQAANAGRRGHPVIFRADLRSELLELSGDRGARDLVASLGDEAQMLELGDEGVVLDMDAWLERR